MDEVGDGVARSLFVKCVAAPDLTQLRPRHEAAAHGGAAGVSHIILITLNDQSAAAHASRKTLPRTSFNAAISAELPSAKRAALSAPYGEG